MSHKIQVVTFEELVWQSAQFEVIDEQGKHEVAFAFNG